MRSLLIPALLVTLAVGSSARADFPREGVDDIPNGLSAPFEGSWAVGHPDAKGTMDGPSEEACNSPVQLRANGEHGLVHASTGGPEITYELTAFSGRTTWLPSVGESTIAVWESKDLFYAYSTNLTDGSARWDDPRVYRRCP